jgi:hypothetical protein
MGDASRFSRSLYLLVGGVLNTNSAKEDLEPTGIRLHLTGMKISVCHAGCDRLFWWSAGRLIPDPGE